MEITYAAPKDIEGWISLVEEVKESFPGLDMESYKQTLVEGIDKKEAMIAKIEETIVGTLAFDLKLKELNFLAVSPKYRRKGIAKELIKKCISLFPKGTNIKVITYREDDLQGLAARKLYKSMGFECGNLITVFNYPCQEMNYTVK